MPKPGDRQTYSDQSGHPVPQVWVVCPSCQQGRWVNWSAARRASFTGWCSPCWVRKEARASFRLRAESEHAREQI